jgi:hypothetical protein
MTFQVFSDETWNWQDARAGFLMEPCLVTHNSLEMPFVFGGEGGFEFGGFFFSEDEQVWKTHSQSVNLRRYYSCGVLPSGWLTSFYWDMSYLDDLSYCTCVMSYLCHVLLVSCLTCVMSYLCHVLLVSYLTCVMSYLCHVLLVSCFTCLTYFSYLTCVMSYLCHVLLVSCLTCVISYLCHVLLVSSLTCVMSYLCHVLLVSCLTCVISYLCHVLLV